MLNVSEDLKNLYRLEHTRKDLVLSFPTINKTITNDGIVMESMKLTESICEEEELTFGGCNSAMFEISIFNVTENLQGQKMVVTQNVYTEDGTSYLTMPLGTYYVDTLKKQTNGMYTDLVAYDRMKDTDTDVSAWYNGLVFPITIKSMRESLYTFLGLSYEVQTLPLDNISIAKTINPSYLKARDVLYAISEANATFGKITREDKIKHIGLGGIGLYPSETLYPSENLFPSESTETQTNARLYDAWYEDYIVESIDSISIVDADGVVGITVGATQNNPYVVKGNFIFYGMDNATLTTVANLLLLSVKNKFYRPADLTMVGLPYMEVGDTVATINDETTIETFIFERVLSGIQALSDNVIAKGNAKRENNVDINTQIEQLNGKTLKIVKSVDEVSVNLSDLASDTAEQFSITNGQILLKVDSSGKVVSVALGADPSTGSLLEIKADNINLEGLVSVNGNFKVLLDGSIEAVNAKFSGTISASTITGGTISGSTISGNAITGGTITGTTITGGSISGSNIIAKDYFYIRDALDSVDRKVFESNQSVLRFGEGFANGIDILVPIVVTGSVGCQSVNTGAMSCAQAYVTNAGTSVNTANCRLVESTGAIMYASSSSQRYKKDITEDLGELEPSKIYDIPVKKFKYKDGYLQSGDDRENVDIIGFIAEDIEKIYPIAVDRKENGEVEMWNINILFPCVVKLVQEQKKQIDSLQNRLDKLEELLKTKGVI